MPNVMGGFAPSKKCLLSVYICQMFSKIQEFGVGGGDLHASERWSQQCHNLQQAGDIENKQSQLRMNNVCIQL